MNELLTNVKTQIIAQIRATSNIERITKELLNSILEGYRLWMDGNRILSAKEKKVLHEELSNYFIADLNYATDLVELERGMVICDPDPKKHTDWEPDTKKRFYWRKQREFLMTTLERKNGQEESSRIINSIDFETDTILKNMENPIRSDFDSRGLVVGYVQSGKTANFTALIAKAADAGYRFIIVLAGIHDELRQQTQIRIDRELTGHNNLNLEGDFIAWNDYEEVRRWHNLTSAGWLDGKETGEFSGKGINKFKDIFLSKERPVLAIIKKNVKIMERLIKWIENSEEKDRVNVPILIIDDEADQASVDSNANKKNTDPTDPTKTNEKIRNIIELFVRKAYVGYTATPFANVFIQHDSEHEKLGDDLYPRNFIHSLPEPRGYFGTRRIFADDLDNFFVKQIKDSQKEKKELADRGIITADLVSSVYDFLLGIAIRNLRGQEKMPMSMMINVDHRVNKMNRIGEVIKNYVLKSLPEHYDINAMEAAFIKYNHDSKNLNEKLASDNKYFEWRIVKDELIKIIKSKAIKISVLNSSNEDKLDYAKDPSMKVIAVGGNKLSRGLTLEGLMVTFYLRESKQYDTLLQMGRWFGYRKGYEDLVRIYTNNTLWRQFKDLAIVELEFRESISEMVNEDPPKTPKEFAIAVRQILGLLPTAKNKLGAAVLETHYGGSQVSVTRLTLEKPEIIDANTRCVSDLIAKINAGNKPFAPVTSGSDIPSSIAADVPFAYINSFIIDFHIANDTDNTSLEFDKNNLIKYLAKKTGKGELLKWNVAIISVGKNEDNNIISLPGNINLRAVNRARMKTSPVNGSYNIKAVTSKTDRVIDLPKGAKNEYDGRTSPLLLLYFISRNSKPMQDNEKSSRESLYKDIEVSKHRDPVSYSIIFPSDKDGKGIYKQPI
jgi:hypothetical protein